MFLGEIATVLIASTEKFSLGLFSFKVGVVPLYMDTGYDSLRAYEEAIKRSGRNVVERKFVRVYGTFTEAKSISYEDLDTVEMFYVVVVV